MSIQKTRLSIIFWHCAINLQEVGRSGGCQFLFIMQVSSNLIEPRIDPESRKKKANACLAEFVVDSRTRLFRQAVVMSTETAAPYSIWCPCKL